MKNSKMTLKGQRKGEAEREINGLPVLRKIPLSMKMTRLRPK